MTPEEEILQELKADERSNYAVIALLISASIALVTGFGWVMAHYVR
jgi:hypothetical protein